MAGLALFDLVRYSLYILIFAVLVQVLLSWLNPYSPVAPVFNAMTRPFLRRSAVSFRRSPTSTFRRSCCWCCCRYC